MTHAWLEELTYDDCIELLGALSVGRIAVVVDGRPIVLPVNYRLVQAVGATPGAWIALRTRPGNVIDQAADEVAFEIDTIDTHHQEGSSVLVQGTLHQIEPDNAHIRARFDPQPWLDDQRDAWLLIEPTTISGRRLHAAETEWAFHIRAYL
jgi:nitroimidazol reductase NimA-like FMN-containing flavoprotein (pyridoxamine 5'-phosphate oxidase superfamily)